MTFIKPVSPKPEKEGRYILVFYGNLKNSSGTVIESDVPIGRVVENIKLSVPYVFIVQDRIVINSQPQETSSRGFNPYAYDNAAIGYDSAATGYVYTDTVEKINKWDISKQYAEGRFVSYFDIEEIRIEYPSWVISTYGNLPLPKLYIDGQLVSNGIWMPSDSSTQPVSWKIENANGSKLYLLGPMKVKLSDGSVATQPICSYSAAYQTSHKNIYGVYVKNPDGSTSATPEPIYLYSVASSQLSLTGISTKLAISNIGGYTERSSYNNWTDADGSVHYWSESVDASGVNYSHTDFSYIKSMTWDSALSMFNGLGSYIPLSVSGRIDRVYSQEEIDNLQSLGIEPVSYSITIQ